jgi:hypothetical protein
MRDTLNYLKVDLHNSRKVGKTKQQPCGVIPICGNSSLKVKKLALKKVLKNGQNSKHKGSQTLELYCTDRIEQRLPVCDVFL